VRILARIGIVATLRKGRAGGKWAINGPVSECAPQYDLYFNLKEDLRYETKQAFIEGGYLWRRVKSAEQTDEREFAPIKTESHTYRTAFGLSHNCDDMEDEEMVLNDQRRDKFRRWFYGTVRPIVRSGGKLRVVGTIIGFDSLLERTMPSERAKDTRIEPLRVWSVDEKYPTGERIAYDKGWLGVKYRAHDPDFSQILWPEAFTEERLRQIRGEFAEMGMLDIYGQEYLNDPIDESTAFFRISDLIPMREQDHETRKTYYAACDFAIGENDRSAYTVIVVGGMDAEGFLSIVDVRRGRWDGLEIIEEMFSVQRRWSPDAFRVESENIAKSLGSFLYRKMDEEQTYLVIDDRSPTKDKDKRARSIQARTRAGKVKFDKEADWYADFEEEITKYPKYAFKDQFDAFAWLGLMLEEMYEPMTQEQEEESEYEEMVYQHFSQGRCEATGY
ncbi:MAG: hypothetical protein HKN13_12685, partial [Rhodothermales bacterium]|nr:hypothetical protein [Rhodothermales bacterium]